MEGLKIGDTLSWRTVNSTTQGVVEQGKEGLIVRLASGHTFRLCDLSEKSITKL